MNTTLNRLIEAKKSLAQGRLLQRELDGRLERVTAEATAQDKEVERLERLFEEAANDFRDSPG